jgi:hypothetical protein
VDAAIDVPIDVAIDAPPDAQACFGTAPFTICLRSAPSQAVVFDSLTSPLNTENDPRCTATVSGGDGYCVIAGTTVTINAGISVQAFGTKPLVLLASDAITTGLLSTIDVGSHRATMDTAEIVGAGADPTCDAGMAPATSSNTSGGGAGGSFIGPGGKGGRGSSNNNSGGSGGVAGAIATAPVTTLRGGCAGQAGAGASNATAGHGGGAVMLIAGRAISVDGNIDASGEGGSGGAAGLAGGAGGGAGGMIVFDAPFIAATTASSLIFANGGGGGEGGNNLGQAGKEGADPNDTGQADGGNRIANGGNGGRGAGGNASAEAGADGTGGSNSGGGGGGGGGTGLIKAPATAVFGSQLSPPPTP